MKTIRSLFISILLGVLLTIPVAAQTGLTVTLRKDFGFNNGSHIRGTFTVNVKGPDNLKSVTYLFDGKLVKEFSTPPFAYQFKTTDFADGWHEISVSARTSGDQTLSSSPQRFEFLTAEQQQASMAGIIGPILGLIAVILLVSIGFQFIAFRSRKHEPVPLGTQRSYGIHGGGICPRCGRPMRFHLTAINAGLSKVDVCENCGRFGLVRERALKDLRLAEAAELQNAQPFPKVHEPGEMEKLKQQLDASRYEDSK